MTENSRNDLAVIWKGRIDAQGDARNAATVKPDRTKSDGHRFVQAPAPATPTAMTAVAERTSVQKVELILGGIVVNSAKRRKRYERLAS